MRFNLEQWIAHVQAKPDHVRMRYLVGSVTLSMLMVLGVWSLSVSEGVRALSQSAQETANEVQGILPKTSNFSLDSLLSGEKSLEERKKEVSGELFFQEQLDSKQSPNFEEDGAIAPAEDETAPAPTR